MRKQLLFLLFSLACYVNQKEEDIHKTLPTESFVFIEQELDTDICPVMTSGVCVKSNTRNAGSGVIVGRNINEEKSYVLTAEHLCEEPESSILTDTFMKQNVKDHRMIVNDSIGDRYRASIIRTDKDIDLCLLEINMIAPEPIPVSDTDPQAHDKIWNIAAPAGIWDPYAVVIFDGYFDGINLHGQSVYSMPTSPGSSGSPIFNKEQELVGIISAASPNWNVGFGANRQDIENFVRVYMPQ